MSAESFDSHRRKKYEDLQRWHDHFEDKIRVEKSTKELATLIEERDMLADRLRGEYDSAHVHANEENARFDEIKDRITVLETEIAEITGKGDVAKQEVAPELLKLITTVEVPGIDSFVAKKKFREDETIDGVRIIGLSKGFKKNFLRKTETSIAPATLRIQQLREDSLDQTILAELGDTAEITLAQLWEMLKKQGKGGEEGDLPSNGYASVFYIPDANGNLWAVRAYLDTSRGGWQLVADSVAHPLMWERGGAVVSR